MTELDAAVATALQAWRESDQHLITCAQCRGGQGGCLVWQQLYWHAVSLREILLGTPVVNLRQRRPLSLV